MKVELVYVSQLRQELLEFDVEERCTAGELIANSGIAARFPEDPIDTLEIGVWGRPVDRDTILRDGDRVEIYRPLLMDPREARLRRVKD